MVKNPPILELTEADTFINDLIVITENIADDSLEYYDDWDD